MANHVKNEKALLARKKKLQAELAQVEKDVKQVRLVNKGDVPAPEIARLIKSQQFSYGVAFLRTNETVLTSDRRFATYREANQHAARFCNKHGHKTYAVNLVPERANAWVNWATGKTNPVIGR